MGVTQDLARFAAETPSGRLPKSVPHATKRAAINALGVALFSSQDPALRILLDLFAEEGGAPRATVWGAATRTSATNAALANGFAAHLEDYDDTHFPTLVHVSAPTLPAAWAAAEIAGASGRDLLTAVALGIEVCSRVCLAFHPWHYDEGWHITGTLGVFGAAAAAGRILGLDAGSMARAFGIAGAQSAGVREGFGTMTKPLHAARAAQAGLTAALLAADGFTAPETILEGRRGLGAVLSPEVDLSRATEALGERWEIFQDGLKPYACCLVTHPAIDAALAIRSRPGFDAGAVRLIEAVVNPLVPELTHRPEPTTGLEAKFSVQHCIAVALLAGAAYPAQFEAAVVNDEGVARLRRATRLTVDASIPEDACVLRVALQDGTWLEERVEHATGSPENPISDERLSEKFLALVSPMMGEAAAALLERLWRLEGEPSVAGLLP
ncbi:MAG TPA: MmgE/PrpD family protein [Dehalococcoidia bacterium]|nr:MmgE/PrpD family protein [Dehalococcoidia bacterium]